MGKRILVIDDEQIIQHLIAAFLKHAGYEVLIANTCEEGLEILKNGQFELVTCDLMMPDMSGYDFLKKLKAEEALSAIPVIIITAAGSATDEDLLRQLGAAAIVSKPFTGKILETVVANVFDS